ncbi:MAG: hypothetical protein ABIO24_14760, partial [Saprospiraceae bacterium]
MDSSIATSIKEMVDAGRTSEALTWLLEASRPNQQVHATVLRVLGEFNDLTAQRLLGTITTTEATERLNSIHDKIRMALDSFDSAG